MLQRRRRRDLLHEPLGAEHGGEFGLQHLERDLALVLEVLGEIHGRHAALPELALDAVAIGQRRRETLCDAAQRVPFMRPSDVGEPVLHKDYRRGLSRDAGGRQQEQNR